MASPKPGQPIPEEIIEAMFQDALDYGIGFYRIWPILEHTPHSDIYQWPEQPNEAAHNPALPSGQ